MEAVLDIYKKPYDPRFPVVCMDESPRQLIKETKLTIPARPGSCAKYDYEYERCGTYNVFIASEALAGKRFVEIKVKKTKKQWAVFIEQIAEHYKIAEKIVLVMDNLNTHKAGSLYEIFQPEKAKKLLDRFQFVYTPKHGSWLNMAEIELNVLIRQCLKRRIDKLTIVKNEIKSWEKNRNNMNAKINWQFTTEDARIKLKRLYPTLHS